MKPLSNPHSLAKGSIILYVLVLIAIVSLLFVGWIELMTARGQTTDILTYSIKRRIAAQNANAILRQYLTSNVLNTSTGSLPEISLPNGWGGVAVPTTWTKAPGDWAYPDSNANPFNPSGTGAYNTTLMANLTWTISIAEEGIDASANEAALAVVRTRSWTDISAWFAAPSPYTIYTIDADTLTKNATTAPFWFTSNNSTHAVTIDLTASPPYVIQVSNSTNCTINGNATVAAATANHSISILIDNSATTALTNIAFVGNNYQPLYLALSNPIAAARINWNFTSGASWKMTSVLQVAPVQINNAPTIDGFILYDASSSALNANTSILRTQGWDEIYAP